MICSRKLATGGKPGISQGQRKPEFLLSRLSAPSMKSLSPWPSRCGNIQRIYILTPIKQQSPGLSILLRTGDAGLLCLVEMHTDSALRSLGIDYMEYWVLNPGWLCSRQMPYSLYYCFAEHCGTEMVSFSERQDRPERKIYVFELVFWGPKEATQGLRALA